MLDQWVTVVAPNILHISRRVPRPDGGTCILVREVKITPTPRSEFFVGVTMSYEAALDLQKSAASLNDANNPHN